MNLLPVLNQQLPPSQLVVSSPAPSGVVIDPQQWITAEVWHRLDLSAPRNRELLAAALTEDELPGSADTLNVPIRVSSAIISRASKERDGELQEWPRVVLVCDSGALIAHGSAGVYKSICGFVLALGEPPWSPPVYCCLRAKKEGERRWHWLQRLDPAGKPITWGPPVSAGV